MSNTGNTKPINILLVEDNEGDVFLTKRAFGQVTVPTTIHVAEDGEMAMEMLLGQGGHDNFPRPDMVLLDLNLPKKDGKQVLAEMKQDDNLKTIPVVILSSSQAAADILQSYGLHANSYIKKPDDSDRLQDVVTAIEKFWFNAAILPGV